MKGNNEMQKTKNEVIGPVSIQHPTHYVPQEVAAALKKLNEHADAERAYRDEIDQITRPTAEERAVKAALRIAELKSAGITPDTIKKLRDIRTERSDRVAKVMDRRAGIRIHFESPLADIAPPEPAPADPTFWWANSQFESDTPLFFGSFDKHGLHVAGGINEQSGDLQKRSFKLTALFGLAAARIPLSQSRTWISTPPIEIIGEFFVDGADNLGQGDQWVKCWVHRNQKIWQPGFAGEPIPLGQAHDSENIAFVEDDDIQFHVPMKGFQLMPAVLLKGVNTSLTLWSSLEVRFDFQTEGAGCSISISSGGGLHIRTFQWPLTALP